jgi:hypothetical protein
MFVSLQVLDLLTTLLGMRFGAQEASPFVRWLMQIGPVEGLVVAKAGAFALAGICLWARRQRVILWINYWYAALILWNLRIILVATPH